MFPSSCQLSYVTSSPQHREKINEGDISSDNFEGGGLH